MSGSLTETESAAATVLRGFESIPARLKVLGEHIAEGIAHPFAPPVVKIALPMLLSIIEDLRQEVAELRKPCPCNPEVVQPNAPGVSTSEAVEKAPEVVHTLAEDMTAKWSTYDDALAAFTAGSMNQAEVEAFTPMHERVKAFAASLSA
jgi:hypothetical protein